MDTPVFGDTLGDTPWDTLGPKGRRARETPVGGRALCKGRPMGVEVELPTWFRTRRLGHTPSTAGTFRKKFRNNSGRTPETLSERFLEFPSRVRLGCPKPYNSRHLRLPEHFQNSLPPSTAGRARPSPNCTPYSSRGVL